MKNASIKIFYCCCFYEHFQYYSKMLHSAWCFQNKFRLFLLLAALRLLSPYCHIEGFISLSSSICSLFKSSLNGFSYMEVRYLSIYGTNIVAKIPTTDQRVISMFCSCWIVPIFIYKFKNKSRFGLSDNSKKKCGIVFMCFNHMTTAVTNVENFL